MRAIQINLRDTHKASGKSVYQVAKDTGLIYNTVDKYASEIIYAKFLPLNVITLCEYYKVDWHDPNIVQVVEVKDSESTGQLKTLLAPA